MGCGFRLAYSTIKDTDYKTIVNITNMKKLRIVIVFLVAGILMLPGACAGVPSGSPVDSLINQLIRHDKFMGSIAILDKGEITYARACGYADIERQIPSGTETIYRIGSVTKMFTATMVYQLFGEKKLTPEMKLSAWFPQLPDANEITLEQMLLHRSGLWSVTSDPGYLEWNVAPKTQTEILEMIQQHPPLFAPGTESRYSNSNYILLGYILEDATGKSYQENLKERILDKAGLVRTSYGGTTDPSRGESYSYRYEDGAWAKENETHMSIPHGAGAMVSTPSELVRFIEALFSHKLISEPLLAGMTTVEGDFGKGIFPMTFEDMKGFGHTGGIDGFSSVLLTFPEKELSIAICSNGLSYSQNEILKGVLSLYLGMPYEIPGFKVAGVPAEKLKSYEGVYAAEDFPLKLTIRYDGQQLTGQGTGQAAFPLEASSEQEFRFDQAGIRITFTEPGKMQLKQGGLDLTFTREEPE